VELAGRVALVTGGGTGLGAAVCRALGEAGAAVAVNYSRSEDEAREVTGSLESAGARALAVRADVRDEAAVLAMAAAVERELGPVDLLVNNAAVTRYVPFADLAAVREEDWQRAFGVNVLGAWNCVRAVAPGMRARAAGAIVNVASDSVLTLDGSSIPYVVSKAALVALTRTLARALAPLVRVNAVAPGWMETPWLDRNLPEDVRRKLAAGAEGMTDVADVCREVLRLLADDAASGEIVLIAGPPVD
jgi:3-oxoacyl-[acyl-carrier protein] reductase